MEKGKPSGLVFVLSGPSGAGKTELEKLLRQREPTLHYCVTATTRPPRPGERNGVDYHFYGEQEFVRLEREGAFLEFARIPPDGGYLYGTPRQQVEDALNRGQDVLLHVDVQGAAAVRRQMPRAVTIFLKPPDLDTLRRRLLGRASEGQPDMDRRLANAQAELAREPEFDHSVANADGQLAEAVDRVQEIIREARRVVQDRRSS